MLKIVEEKKLQNKVLIHVHINFISLQPLLQEYQEYAETIDEVNDLGGAYDNLQNPEMRPSSPFRKIMSKFNETK